jgi:competence protein ComEA
LEVPERPDPARREVSARAGEWLTWFGPARLVTSAVAVLVVCVGLYWLVRSPAPATEDLLPMATGGGSAAPTSVVSVTTAAPAGPVSVHVAGAVARPGVYELQTGGRVEDAIAAAGGPLEDAEPDALNLAAPVVDGSKIHVPKVGEEVPTSLAGADGPSAVEAGPIDINRAGEADLDLLPGVGPATAAAIVQERERNGPFLTVDELVRVPGIGPAKLDALRDLVTT